MKGSKLGRTPLIAATLALGLAQCASAGIIYVTDSLGNVWQYNGISHMSTQTQTSNTGILVRDQAVAGNGYRNDQDATADLSTGKVYRINNGGNVIEYPNVAAYLTNTLSTTVATGIYTGDKAINGASYDGATGGFYTVYAAGTPNQGDIATYSTLALFLAGTPDITSAAAYNGNVLNFYDPDTTPGTTVAAGGSLPINAQYYQVPSGGGLEGFANLASYIATANNRANFGPSNAFGGTTPTYQARAAFAIPVPEPTSAVLCIIALCGTIAGRGRK
jgi:hypothetical protein